MAFEEKILQNLKKGATGFDELKKTFPQEELAETLMNMEERQLVENKKGIWIITEKGKKKIKKERKITQNLLVVPAVCFFLLSAHFYVGYTDVQDANTQLLLEKAEKEEQLSSLYGEKEEVEAEHSAKLTELAAEQNNTSLLHTSHEETKDFVQSLQEELDHYECMEKCTPDVFVTVDNPYVKAKVDEITRGLTSLKKKQRAVYEFVRDEIELDHSIFGSGRIDSWEYPEDILKRGKGDIEDKFLLLLTMLRIAGTPAEHVKFVAAEVDGNDNWAWVEAYDGSNWWVLDPFEEYNFTSNPKDTFYTQHKVVVLWWFNDKVFKKG